MAWDEPMFEREHFMMLLIGAIILIVLAVFFLPYKTLKAVEFPAKVYITDNQDLFEINQETNMLDFGVLTPGSRVKKFIEINNNRASEAYVYVKIHGDIRKIIEIEEDKFVLNGPRTINVLAKVDEDTKEGTYDGIISVEFKLTLAKKIANIFS